VSGLVRRLLQQVRNAAYKIVAGKGATGWAIALATAQILDALEQMTQSTDEEIAAIRLSVAAMRETLEGVT
jgi:malate/lactate dehydrogenase